MNRITGITAALVVLMTASAVLAGPPTRFVTAKVQEVREQLSTNGGKGKVSIREENRQLRKILDPVIEFERLSQNALRRHWKDLTKAEQSEFVALFQALVFHTYFERIRSDGGTSSIKYEDEEAKGRNAAAVTAIAKTRKAEVELVFHLIRRQNRLWVVEDIVIDEVSLVENYREQFNRIIVKDGFPALLKKMADKLVDQGGEIPPEVKSLKKPSKTASAHGVKARLAELEASNEKMIWRAIDDPRSKVNWGEVEALIEAPPEQIVKTLRNYGGYRNFLPFFTGSKVLKREGEAAIVKLKAKILHGSVTLRAKVKAKEEARPDHAYRFSLRLISGNVRRLDANWTVTPVNRTRAIVTFALLVDPDLWMVPNARLSNYNLVNVRRTIRSLRKRLAP